MTSVSEIGSWPRHEGLRKHASLGVRKGGQILRIGSRTTEQQAQQGHSEGDHRQSWRNSITCRRREHVESVDDLERDLRGDYSRFGRRWYSEATAGFARVQDGGRVREQLHMTNRGCLRTRIRRNVRRYYRGSQLQHPRPAGATSSDCPTVAEDLFFRVGVTSRVASHMGLRRIYIIEPLNHHVVLDQLGSPSLPAEPSPHEHLSDNSLRRQGVGRAGSSRRAQACGRDARQS